jgi:hypothetical protein
MHEGEFGSCCKDLKEAMTLPDHSFFRVSVKGGLYMTIGYAESAQGRAYLDHAPIFCPFCGTQIQDREEIRRKVSKP